jgi:lipopolysaccharide/colanic/teichoic acid biosynthesis glycosyltransferase
LGEPFRGARFRSDLGPISRWVARRRLDLVPLLLNVMRGEMALVGPRPAKQELVLRHQIPDYERRFTVLPGVTGLAQIAASRSGDALSLARRVQYDLYYVDHRSLLLDIRTLFRTFGVVLSAPRPAQRLSTSETDPHHASAESGGTSAASEDGATGVVPAGGVAAEPPAVK